MRVRSFGRYLPLVLEALYGYFELRQVRDTPDKGTPGK